MTENLKKRVVSQRGASLSFALFVFLVCAMVSAAVLAAATAASGQYVNLGSSDQHYYSIISAANLFRGAVDDNGDATYTFTETIEATYNARGETLEEILIADEEPMTVNFADPQPLPVRDPAFDSEFDFLADVTKLALYGDTGEPEEAPSSLEAWQEQRPFASLSSGQKEATYTITPTITDDDKLKKAVTVVATVRVHDDWLVEVVISSLPENDSDDSNQQSLYMAFQGTCIQGDPSISGTLGDTTGSSVETVSNTVTVYETRTATVTWHMVQMTMGRGFFDEE